MVLRKKNWGEFSSVVKSRLEQPKKVEQEQQLQA